MLLQRKYVWSNQSYFKINHNIEIGGVRSPLANLVEEDMPKVEAVAKLIRDTEAKYL